MTRMQKIFLVSLALCGTREIIVRKWTSIEPGPIIRADLIFIYAVLALPVSVSLIQFIRNRTYKS